MRRVCCIMAGVLLAGGLCFCWQSGSAHAQMTRPPLVVPPETVERGQREAARPARPEEEELPISMGDELNRKRVQAAIHLRRNQTDEGLKLLDGLVRKHPKNFDLRTDYADALLEAGRLKELDEQIMVLNDQNPLNPRLRFLKARTLMKKQRYKEADAILKELIGEYPLRADYVAEHGRAQLNLGNLYEAMALMKRSLLLKSDQPWLRRDLARLTRENTTRLTTRTLYVDQARQTSFFRNELALVGPVAERLKLGFKWRGNLVEREAEEFSPAGSEDNHTVLAMLEYRFNPRFKLGVEAGPILSGPDAVTYGLNASYNWPDLASISGSVEINYPWDDPVSAAEEMGLYDRAVLRGEISAVKNWVASYNLEYRRYFLNEDDKYADRYIGSFSLGRILYTHPYMLLSGTWYYSRVNKEENFSQDLLISEENAPGLNLYSEARLSSYVTGWGSFGARRDLARDLNAFDLALGFRWQVLPFLTLKPGYFYTNDSESLGGGDSHNLLLETEFLF